MVRRMLAAALGAVGLAAIAAPEIRVEPAHVVLDGDPVRISIAGVPARSEVTLVAQRWFAPLSTQRRPPRLMQSSAVFMSDGEGRIDLQSSPSLRGTYEGIDPRGPFWSMRPVNGESAPDPVDTTEVRFELRIGDKAQAVASVRLIPALPEVHTLKVDSLPGAVFATLPGPAKRPAVVILGGSEGGSLVTLAAAPLASHGFAVLALPVFSPPQGRAGTREIEALPAAWVEMPVEVLDRACAWLATRPEVDANRIALHGTSMGALLALLGAVHLEWPAAVVASVPSDIVWDGWGPGVELGTRSTFSVGGKPLPFVPLEGYEEELKGFERQEPVILRRAFENGRRLHADRVGKARVPVERIRVPVMVIGGFADQMWPSGEMARNIVESRRAAGRQTEALLFPDAGHSLYDTGYSPTTQYNAGLRKTGGTPEANAKAQAEAWPRTIRFLRRALGLE